MGNSNKTISGLIGNMAAGAAIEAAYGAAGGAIGSAVMDAAGFQYSVSEAVRVGAAGSSVIGAALGGASYFFGNPFKGKNIAERIGITVLASAAAAGGGALGSVMLNTALTMSTEQLALALAIGAGILGGAVIALDVAVSLCCGATLLTCGCAAVCCCCPSSKYRA